MCHSNNSVNGRWEHREQPHKTHRVNKTHDNKWSLCSRRRITTEEKTKVVAAAWGQNMLFWIGRL